MTWIKPFGLFVAGTALGIIICIFYTLPEYNNEGRTITKSKYPPIRWMNVGRNDKTEKPVQNDIGKMRLSRRDEMMASHRVDTTTEVKNSNGTQISNEIFDGYRIPAPDCDRRLLIVNFRHGVGLGDRLRGIVSAFMLALWTNRTLGIIITDTCPLTDFFIPNQYDWTKCMSSFKQSVDNVGYTTIRKNDHTDLETLPSSGIWKHRVVVLKTNLYFEIYIKKYASAKKIVPWLFGYTRFNVRHVLYHVLFKLEPKFKLQIDNYINKITNNGSLSLVGVHIRYLYTLGHPEYIKQIFKWMGQFNNVNKYAIYIASENGTVRQEVLKQFKGSHSLNLTGITLHVASKTANCDSLFFAAFEQHLLSRSDVIIKTRSSFSQVANIIRGGHGEVYEAGLRNKNNVI